METDAAAGDVSTEQELLNSNSDFRQHYTLVEKIGGGVYSQVYSGKDKHENCFAFKVHSCRNTEDTGIAPWIIREASIMCLMFPCKNIVSLNNVMECEQIIVFVMPICNCDLRLYITNLNATEAVTMPADKLRSYTSQILSGVAYIHQQQVMHCDLKPQNILLLDDDTIKICDFGISRYISLSQRAVGYINALEDLFDIVHDFAVTAYENDRATFSPKICCTLPYRPTDVILGNHNYDQRVDDFSVGCIIAEMVQLKIIWGLTELACLEQQFMLFGTPTEETWPGVTRLPAYKNLVPFLTVYTGNHFKEHFEHPGPPDIMRVCERMLQMNPDDRMSAKDALEILKAPSTGAL